MKKDKEDDEDKSCGPISPSEGGLKCPMCDGVYPENTFEKIPKGTANQRPKKQTQGDAMASVVNEPEEEPGYPVCPRA